MTPLRYCLLMLACAGFCYAWDTPPHRKMTQAAIEIQPPRFRAQLGAEAVGLAEIYCLLPDRYMELERYGFTRKSPGPRTLAEMQPYCLRPDGEAVHSATWDRDEDLGSLVFLFERIVRSLSEKRQGEAARYMGTLAHFLEDSLSPPHAGSELAAVHGPVERSVPEFTLGNRKPRMAAGHIVPAAEAVLSRCYAAAEQNRRDAPLILAAARAGDEAALNPFRLRAAKAAAELLADAMFTLFSFAER